MIPWTHDQREAFIRRAVEESLDTRGYKGTYFFNVMPKNAGYEEDDGGKRAKVTEALANAIYNSPEFKVISLKLYEILLNKINCHPNLSRFDISNIMLVVKGSNAYATLLSVYNSAELNELFTMSDLDLMILINPNLPSEHFQKIQAIIHTIVTQSISQFKRTLDHMLFLDRPTHPINDAFLTKDQVQKFQQVLADELSKLDTDDEKYISPIFNEEVRNSVSRNSFIILDSEGHDNSVVRIEVPHFNKCECIPLRKTPLFCSYNNTLEFNRAAAGVNLDLKANFNLYRLRMNVLVKSTVDDEKDERVSADFIDITIPSQTDSELIHFWKHGRCVLVWDESINTWICVPDMHTCMNDLFKMLYVYQCPASKKEKRLAKFKVFEKLTTIHI